MHARDSYGRSVSLLNDDESHVSSYSSSRHYTYTDSSRSDSSSPTTTIFTRADSYDSSVHRSESPSISTRNQTAHPTPYPCAVPHLKSLSHAYPEKMSHDDKHLMSRSHGSCSHNIYKFRESFSEPLVFEEDPYSLRSTGSSDRGPKRYPCRYRDSHHCQKTFTTSGHASRHSKIHTAEKAVSCTWEGCHKKFTRSDNMKQHLETHTKERSRPVKGSATATSSHKSLLWPARVRKSASPPIKSCRLPTQQTPSHTYPKADSRLYSPPGPLTIPSLNLSSYKGINPRVAVYPDPVLRPKSLDALALAAASGPHP
ncbi:hypothetical protein K3495_g2323 [Podosphaera aphanis]|nr:hypothetical protein K3495_g2323 [Podosphaera aphanis]